MWLRPAARRVGDNEDDSVKRPSKRLLHAVSAPARRPPPFIGGVKEGRGPAHVNHGHQDETRIQAVG